MKRFVVLLFLFASPFIELLCGSRLLMMRKRLKRSGTFLVMNQIGGRVYSLLVYYSQQIRETLNLAEDIPIEFTAHGESPAKVAAALAAASLEENATAATEATAEETAPAEGTVPAKTEA
jgi:hypothetical protein